MDKKIIEFFNISELTQKKEISTDKLLALLSQHKIATNSGDAYYFLRICRGLNILEHIKTKTYKINREELAKLGVERDGKE